MTINLANNSLEGQIPSEWGYRDKLQSLILNDNILDGGIPSSLANLENLDFLYLQNNELEGPIPSAIGDMPSLSRWYLAGNNLSPCLPTSLLNIEENDFTFLGLIICLPTPKREVLCPLAGRIDPSDYDDNSTIVNTGPGSYQVHRSSTYMFFPLPDLGGSELGLSGLAACGNSAVATASVTTVNTSLYGAVYHGYNSGRTGSLGHSTPILGQMCTNSRTCLWQSGFLFAGQGWGNQFQVYGTHRISSSGGTINTYRTTGGYSVDDVRFAQPPPHPPLNVDATVNSQNFVNLTWTTEPDVASYVIEKSEDEDSDFREWEQLMEIRPPGQIAFLLACGDSYYLRIRSKGSGSPYPAANGPPSRSIRVSSYSPCPTR